MKLSRFPALFLMVALAALAAPGLAHADPDKDESGQGRRRDPSDRPAGDREGGGRDSELRKDLDERDRELRKAAAERDRELEQAADEADREDKPEKYDEKSQQIWAKYDEKRERIRSRFEEKHGAAAHDARGEDRDGRDERGGRDPGGDRPRRRDADEPPRRPLPRDEFPPDERRDNLLKKLAAAGREIDQEHDRHEARMNDLRRMRDVREDRGREGKARRATNAMKEENARHAKRLGELEARRDDLRLAVDRREEELRGPNRRKS